MTLHPALHITDDYDPYPGRTDRGINPPRHIRIDRHLDALVARLVPWIADPKPHETVEELFADLEIDEREHDLDRIADALAAKVETGRMRIGEITASLRRAGRMRPRRIATLRWAVLLADEERDPLTGRILVWGGADQPTLPGMAAAPLTDQIMTLTDN